MIAVIVEVVRLKYSASILVQMKESNHKSKNKNYTDQRTWNFPLSPPKRILNTPFWGETPSRRIFTRRLRLGLPLLLGYSFQFSIFPYEFPMFYSLHSAPSWETQSDNLIGMHTYAAASGHACTVTLNRQTKSQQAAAALLSVKRN